MVRQILGWDKWKRLDKWWDETNVLSKTNEEVRQMKNIRHLFKVMMGRGECKNLDKCLGLNKWWGEWNEKG